MDDNNLSAWLQMQMEQNNHGRHHEALRSQSTNMIIAISAAVLAFLASTTVWEDKTWALAAFLFIINVYGFIMSLKHYERSRLHFDVARHYANVISDATKFGEQSLNDVRTATHALHKKEFSLIRKIRVYYLWSGLHLLIAGMGVLLIV